MHERKSLMADLSDGFIALPGGIGTMEEFIEVLTWVQLGIHKKPCGLLNICDYYEKLIGFLDHIADEKFIEQAHRDMVFIDENPYSLLKRFEVFEPPDVDKAKWAIEMDRHHGTSIYN